MREAKTAFFVLVLLAALSASAHAAPLLNVTGSDSAAVRAGSAVKLVFTVTSNETVAADFTHSLPEGWATLTPAAATVFANEPFRFSALVTPPADAPASATSAVFTATSSGASAEKSVLLVVEAAPAQTGNGTQPPDEAPEALPLQIFVIAAAVAVLAALLALPPKRRKK